MVFDHQEGGSLVHEAMKEGDQQGDVIEVEACGRFVENEQGRGIWGGSGFLLGVALGFFGFLLRGKMGDKFESLGFSTGKLAEGLTAPEIAEADFGKEREGTTNLLMTFARSRRKGFAWREVLKSFRGSHLQKLVDGFSQIWGGQNVGLEAATFAGWTGDKHVRKELHRDFLVTHSATTFTTAASGIEGEGRGRQSGGLGFLGGGVEFPDKIIDIEVEQGGGTGGLAERGLVDENDFGDVFGTGQGFEFGKIFDGSPHPMEQGFMDNFMNQGAFA
jgi:hypothetical protein